MASPVFEIGDFVQWHSQAKGYRTQKTGIVREVVPAGEFPKARLRMETAYPRSYESYIVEVGERLYWPKLNNMQAVDEEEFNERVATDTLTRRVW